MLKIILQVVLLTGFACSNSVFGQDLHGYPPVPIQSHVGMVGAQPISFQPISPQYSAYNPSAYSYRAGNPHIQQYASMPYAPTYMTPQYGSQQCNMPPQECMMPAPTFYPEPKQTFFGRL